MKGTKSKDLVKVILLMSEAFLSAIYIECIFSIY